MAPSKRKIRVVVGDDSRNALLSVCGYLEFEGQFEIVGTATDGVQVIHQAERFRPDLVLTDLSRGRFGSVTDQPRWNCGNHGGSCS